MTVVKESLPGLPAVRIATLQWAVGIFCGAIGALMLVAPHQFSPPSYAALHARLPIWGGLFLAAGLGLLVAASLAPRRGLVLVAHAGGGLALLLLASGFLTTGNLTGLAIYLVLGVGTVIAPLLVPAGPPADAAHDRDLFVLLLAAGAMLIGILLLAVPDQFTAATYDRLRPALPAFGGAFLLSGLAWVLLLRWATPPAPARWLAHGLLAATFMAWMLTIALPQRLWTGVLLYGGSGLVVALQPWIHRARVRPDPYSLRTRLALVLAIAAAVPLITVVVIGGRWHEQIIIDETLARQRLLAATLAEVGRREASLLTPLVEGSNDPEVGVVLLLDGGGRVVAGSAGARDALGDDRSASAPFLASRAVPGQVGTLRYTDARGSWLAAHAVVPGQGAIVVEQPLGRTLTGRREVGDMAFGLLLVAVGLAAFAGDRAAHRLVEPLARLARAVANVEAGADAVPLPPSGVTEVAQVADALAALRVRLAARTEERARAETALRFLANASQQLATSLDEEETIQRAARLAVPFLADGCSVHVVDAGGAIRHLAVAHVDPAKERSLRRLREEYPIVPDGPHPIADVLRTGQPSFRPVLDEAALRPTYPDPAEWALARTVGFRSAMTVPLTARGRLLGAYSFLITETARRYTPDDLALAEELARRTGLAVDNARLYRQAQEAIRLREEFLSIASHELRTPLTTVKGYVQLLTRHLTQAVPEPTGLRRLVEPLQRQVGHLELLVADLLDVARLQHGQMALRREPLDLGQLVATVVERLEQSRHRTDGHALVIDAPEAVVGRWDPARLDQVLTNLIANGLKYSPHGGEVRVAVRRDGDEAVVTVSDQGLGMDEADQAGLFVPFRRGAATARSVDGAGLGLYIAAQIVRQHGGSIAATSAPGQGSTFTVRLPLADEGRPGAAT